MLWMLIYHDQKTLEGRVHNNLCLYILLLQMQVLKVLKNTETLK